MNNQNAPFDHIIQKLQEHQKNLTKMTKAFTNGEFTSALTDIMYEQNKEEEKRGNVKKMPAKIILTKQGEVVFKFNDPKNGRMFFDTIK